MNNKNMSIAKAYYTAMAAKNISDLEKYLHPDAQLIGPFVQLQSKPAVIEAVKRFTNFFSTLTIRSAFDSADQAVIVYDLIFPERMDKVTSVALLDIKDGLIAHIELIFDARPFVPTP